MKKRINSTGRKKLDAEHIDIRMETPRGSEPASFTAIFDFSSILGLDKNARVYVEPYYKSSSMRFDFGTLSVPQKPPSTVLSELDDNESPRFRVKIVDESGIVGKILAAANSVRPRNEEEDGFNRKSLLPLITKDLGERLWSLGFDPDSGPELHISSKIAGLSDRIKTDSLLQGAVYPEAFRQVLWKLFDADDFDDEDSWTANWRKFIVVLVGEDLAIKEFYDENDDDEREAFVERCVLEFSNVHSFATKSAKFEEVVA